MTSAAEARGLAAGQRAQDAEAQDAQVRAATQRAAGLVRPGTIVGLGPGCTAGRRPEALHLESLGATVSLRRGNDGSPFLMDQGNHDPGRGLRAQRRFRRAHGRSAGASPGDRGRPVLWPGNRPDHRDSQRGRPPEKAAATACPIESAPSIAGQPTSRLTSTDAEVDGGSHEQTIPMVVDAGADIAVAGLATVDTTRPVPACVTAPRDAVARTASSRTTTAGGA
ncbi:hypothetical protein [Streptomyces shenzhenensis]|uniref:hypothetical protein n=1 Tax=Streptomyces shenzhenensis TaxID=943815 RepID=UPI0011C39ECE|nr:hypothetical protein [Streptomyces shenzhenensis]